MKVFRNMSTSNKADNCETVITETELETDISVKNSTLKYIYERK